MKIRFWGTRGSIAVPGNDTNVYGGNTTCLEITLSSGKTLIIDAGTGIRPLGERLIKEKCQDDIYLLITHIHWDHILGFPFFSPIYNPSCKIHIDGNHNCLRGLKYTFDNRMGDGFFPVKFSDLSARIENLGRIKNGPLIIDDTVIDSIPLHHPQGGIGFRFSEGDKRFVFMTDNELRGDKWDERSVKEYTEFCKGADILIHDSQYTPEEITRHKGWGHSDYEAAFELARRSEAKRLILFHHDPPRTDAQIREIEVLCRGLAADKNSDLMIEAAKENTQFEI